MAQMFTCNIKWDETFRDIDIPINSDCDMHVFLVTARKLTQKAFIRVEG